MPKLIPEPKTRQRLPQWSILAVMLLLFTVQVWPQSFPESAPAISVVYPELTGPYADIFSMIIAGIEDVVPTPVQRHAITKNNEAIALDERENVKDDDVIIALGQRALDATRALAGRHKIVVGAVAALDDADRQALHGIDLALDPELLLAKLKELVPQTKRVHVVYEPTRSDWLIRLAQAAALHQRIHLHLYPAVDIRMAAQYYREICAAGVANEDALWLLPQFVGADDGAVLASILKESWNRRLTVFSGNPEHVKRGVLFALYPDSRGLGRSLGRLALRHAQENDLAPDVTPLRDILIAYNRRTARHLNLRIDRLQERQFDVVLPER